MTSSPFARIAPAREAARPGGQTARANPLEGRGRSRVSARRAHGRLPEPHAFRAGMAARWGGWCRSRFRSREALAVHFGVTFQTACNWWNGERKPSGETVMLACLEWGGAFLDHMRQAA